MTRRFRQLLLAVLSASAVLGTAGAPEISAGKYLRDVRYLASPALDGRGPGTPGLDKAAAYIARQFAKAGVHPLPGRNYFQRFPVSVRSSLGSPNRVSYQLEDQSVALPPADFLPFNFSGEGDIT